MAHWAHEHCGEYEQSLAATQQACEISASVLDQRTPALALGLRSVGLRRLGEVAQAKQCSDEDVALIARHRLSGTWCTRTLIGPADLHLLLFETKGADYRQSARSAVKAMSRHGGHVRDEGAVEAQRVAGTFAWLCGKRRRALAFWSRGFKEAGTLRAPHARARIMVERGGCTDDRHELMKAALVLAKCGATGEQRSVQAVLDGSYAPLGAAQARSALRARWPADRPGHAVQVGRALEEAARCGAVAVHAQQRVDRVNVSVDRSVQALPLTADFDVGPVHTPTRADWAPLLESGRQAARELRALLRWNRAPFKLKCTRSDLNALIALMRDRWAQSRLIKLAA